MGSNYEASVWEQVIFTYEEHGLNSPTSELIAEFEEIPADSVVGEAIIKAYDAIAPQIAAANFADVREDLMRAVERQSMIFWRS